MAHDETSLVDEFRADFKAICGLDAVWCKLHGGPFQQAGLPDVLCATSYGVSGVEFKFARTAKQAAMTPAELIIEELTPRQREVLRSLTHLNGPLRARVIVGAEVEHGALPGGKGTFAMAVDYKDLAETLRSGMSFMGYMLAEMSRRQGAAVVAPRSPILTTQLRCAGEKWDVSHLLFGRVYTPASDAEQAKLKELV